MKKYLVLFLVLISSLCWGDYKDNFNFGKRVFKDKLYEEAIQEFEKVLSNAPTSPEAEEALFYIGESYRLQNNLRKAENFYKRLWEGYPNSVIRDKGLYYYGFMLFEQKQFSESAEKFNLLIDKYPKSEHAKRSLKMLPHCYFMLEDYNQTILTCEKLIRNYSGNPKIPDVFLILAKAYFKNSMPDEGKQTLNKIVEDFSKSDVRWKVFHLQLDLLEKEKGTEKSAEKLAKQIGKKIPRSFEEKFRLKLINYYLKLNWRNKAITELKAIIKRFDNSSKLPEYLTIYGRTLLASEQYNATIEALSKKDKFFRNSSYANERKLIIGKAFYEIGKIDQAKKLVNEIKLTNPTDSILFETSILNADIFKVKGKLKQAIKEYQAIINKYSKYKKNEELLMTIGNIYSGKFQMYVTAIKFYQQLITNYNNQAYQHLAYFKIAGCYEKTGKVDQAIAELHQINVNNVSDASLRQKIVEKRIYLKQFKQKNYDSAITKLVKSVSAFSNNNDKDELRNKLTSVIINDLKDFETGLELLKSPKTPTEKYQKAKLLLKLADKESYQNNSTRAKQLLQEASTLTNKLDPSANKEWIDELKIDNYLVIAKIETASTTADKLEGNIEAFIRTYPSSMIANKYRLILVKFYNNTKFLDGLQYDQSISKEDFISAKLELAESYYRSGDFDKALKNYETVKNGITITKPTIFYHYAASLAKTGKNIKALEKLTFLLNNTDQFEDYHNAINFVANSYKDASDFVKAVKYKTMIPTKYRDDKFYLELSELYALEGNDEKTKESLLYIKNKDITLLKKLADLQFKTKDYHLAEYTYKQLIKKDNVNKRIYYTMIGHIAFVLENYQKAAKIYDKVVVRSISNLPHKERTAEEIIISYYRIENRPKAEKLYDRFEKLLEKNKKAELNIKLNSGIYYVNFNPSKAARIFSKIIKPKETPKHIKLTAYFWRGVAKMELKKADEAYSDFAKIEKSNDTKLKNRVMLKLGTLNFSKENYRKSLDYYYYVIEHDSTGKLALDAAKNFAIVCKTIEAWEKAIDAYEIILERWGNEELQSETVFNIAFCYYRDKKYNQAIKMFQKALPLLTDRNLKAESQYWIAESYFGLDNYEEAVNSFLKVSYNYGNLEQWAATADLKAGEAYIKLRKYNKARYILKKIISRYGLKSRWGKQANDMLKQI